MNKLPHLIKQVQNSPNLDVQLIQSAQIIWVKVLDQQCSELLLGLNTEPQTCGNILKQIRKLGKAHAILWQAWVWLVDGVEACAQMRMCLQLICGHPTQVCEKWVAICELLFQKIFKAINDKLRIVSRNLVL